MAMSAGLVAYVSLEQKIQYYLTMLFCRGHVWFCVHGFLTFMCISLVERSPRIKFYT